MLGNEQKIFHAYLCTRQSNELMVPVMLLQKESLVQRTDQFTICVEDHNLHMRQGKQMC